MDFLTPLGGGFTEILSNPSTIMWCAIGVLIGTIVGALPGVGAITAMAVLLPLTFGLDPSSGLVLLVSIYLGGMYGGRISSILLNIPGEASAVVSTFDGPPLAKQGRAGFALTVSATGAFIGGVIGFIGLASLATVMAKLAIQFGPAEYFLLVLLVLMATSGVTNAPLRRSLFSVVLGLLISMIGTDSVTGDRRFTWGLVDLWDGVDLVVVAIGLFGLSEVMVNAVAARQGNAPEAAPLTWRSLFPPVRDVARHTPSMVRGGGVGFVIGMLPGAGASIATFIAYALEKAVSRDKKSFGKGNPNGLAAPEAADSASVGGALIPTLALGVPGSASGAIVLGGLIIAGLQPGPELFTKSSDVVWTIIAAVLVANILLLAFNTVLVPFFATALRVITPYLAPFIAALCFLGAYSIRSSFFDVALMVGFGALGYLMRRSGYPLAGLLLGVILGPLLEENLRKALLSSQGSISVFWANPVGVTLLVLIALLATGLALRALYPTKPAASQDDEDPAESSETVTQSR